MEQEATAGLRLTKDEASWPALSWVNSEIAHRGFTAPPRSAKFDLFFVFPLGEPGLCGRILKP